jgi:hypothetical protein
MLTSWLSPETKVGKRVVPLCGNMTASTLGSTGVIIFEKKITFAERRSFRLNTV